ncbi:MAG TPA: 50S ribosomal protein L22 [Patescibacteria group bacterium]|nr:50S ribosomal protein L22 [Patescibacteria group bacterium]
MEVIAKARHIRMSPKKVRLVVDLVRGMDVDRAAAQLRFYRKAAAGPVLKLLQSAIANAEHNFKLNAANLYIKKATVDGGPVLKRWRARAFGRAAGIKKRSSHITIVLEERSVAGTPKAVAAAVMKPAGEEKKAEAPAKKAPAKKAAPKEKKPAAKKTK